MEKRGSFDRLRGGSPLPGARRKLVESCSDLRQLVYWMENDRSLGAQADKIVFLKGLLVDVEDQIKKVPRIVIRGATGRYRRI